MFGWWQRFWDTLESRQWHATPGSPRNSYAKRRAPGSPMRQRNAPQTGRAVASRSSPRLGFCPSDGGEVLLPSLAATWRALRTIAAVEGARHAGMHRHRELARGRFPSNRIRLRREADSRSDRVVAVWWSDSRGTGEVAAARLTKLLTETRRCCMVWDCCAMSGYDPNARTVWQVALHEWRDRVSAIHLITESLTVRLGAAGVSAFAKLPLKAWSSEEEIEFDPEFLCSSTAFVAKESPVAGEVRPPARSHLLNVTSSLLHDTAKAGNPGSDQMVDPCAPAFSAPVPSRLELGPQGPMIRDVVSDVGAGSHLPSDPGRSIDRRRWRIGLQCQRWLKVPISKRGADAIRLEFLERYPKSRWSDLHGLEVLFSFLETSRVPLCVRGHLADESFVAIA